MGFESQCFKPPSGGFFVLFKNLKIAKQLSDNFDTIRVKRD